ITNGTNNPLVLVNTTIAQNTNNFFPVSFFAVNGVIEFKNSIVYGTHNGLSLFSAKHSFIEGLNDTTNGNIDATGVTEIIMFTNPALNDFSLNSTAPVINKGNNSYFEDLDSTTIDISGSPRLDGLTIDLGAFEFKN